MATITEDYCSFEIAKLLKEKGFDAECRAAYTNYGKLFTTQIQQYITNILCSKDTLWNCIAPTHQMAIKWLREVYHIEINITFGFPFIDGKQQYKYFWSIVRVCDNHLEYPIDGPDNASYNEEMADSYEEAVEAALKYALENLI